MNREFAGPGRMEPGMAFAFRPESDPRDAGLVRPHMDDEERDELYRALEEESDAAELCYADSSTQADTP